MDHCRIRFHSASSVFDARNDWPDGTGRSAGHPSAFGRGNHQRGNANRSRSPESRSSGREGRSERAFSGKTRKISGIRNRGAKRRRDHWTRKSISRDCRYGKFQQKSCGQGLIRTAQARLREKLLFAVEAIVSMRNDAPWRGRAVLPQRRAEERWSPFCGSWPAPVSCRLP